MYDITRFGLKEMTGCGAALRDLGHGAGCMEEVATRIVRHLYDGVTSGATGRRAFALVRFYKTHDYEALEPPLRLFAERILKGMAPPPGMKCLTLLASAGDEPEWNSRTGSRGHQAIPLPSAAVVSELPMIAQLVRQFGLDISDLVQPSPALLVTFGQRSFNVFHVAEAEGSAHVPAQNEFVRPYGIKSVLGFGGILPSGDLFALIVFSRIPIARETATLFQTVALSVKLAVLPFQGGPVFRPDGAGRMGP
jgi:hypothetical protein